MIAELPKTIRTGPAIAKLIREHFGLNCDRSTISGWQSRHTPPFPRPDDNNAYNVAECFVWVELLQKRKGQGLKGPIDTQMELLDREAASARQRQKITAAEREAFNFEIEKGLYIKRDESEFTIRASMKSYHLFVKQEIEVNNPQLRKEKLIELGASPELIAKFFEYDATASISTVDKIEKRCEQ